MKNLYYPAIFHAAEEGGFWVTFPDFPECMTQGKDWDEAYRMSTEALGLAIDGRIKSKKELPDATPPVDLLVSNGDVSFIIEFDLMRYRKTHNNKAVKKTLTIPEWLNEICTEQNINFSQVLQEALIAKISSQIPVLSNLSKEQLDIELQKGFDDISNNRTVSAEEVESEMMQLMNS